MSISAQRIVSGSTASGTSHSLSVQVDAGANRVLLVCIATAKASVAPNRVVSSTPARDSQSATAVGAGGAVPNYGQIMFYVIDAPNTGTANLTWDTNVATECRAVVYVLDGADASTAAFVAGTNGSTISYAHTGITVGTLVVAAAKRSSTPTWTAGGGMTSDSQGTLGASDVLAVGSLIADATSETPTWTLSGGESGSNVWGSARIAEAVASGPSSAAIHDYLTLNGLVPGV